MNYSRKKEDLKGLGYNFDKNNRRMIPGFAIVKCKILECWSWKMKEDNEKKKKRE